MLGACLSKPFQHCPPQPRKACAPSPAFVHASREQNGTCSLLTAGAMRWRQPRRPACMFLASLPVCGRHTMLAQAPRLPPHGLRALQRASRLQLSRAPLLACCITCVVRGRSKQTASQSLVDSSPLPAGGASV